VEPVVALDKAWTDAERLTAGLDPAQYCARSVCADWDVRALLNHTLGEAQMMTDANRGQAGGNDHGDLVADGADLPTTWRNAGRANVASWRESGMDGERAYFYGTFPAPAAVLINLGEVLVHSWDLAQSTGQEFVVDAELAGLVHGLYSSVPLDGMRSGGMLDPEVPVAADAPMADRMLGLLGRRP